MAKCKHSIELGPFLPNSSWDEVLKQIRAALRSEEVSLIRPVKWPDNELIVHIKFGAK